MNLLLGEVHVIVVLVSCADASILPSFLDNIDMATEGEEVSFCVEVVSEGLLECSVQVFILSNPGRCSLDRIPRATLISVHIGVGETSETKFMLAGANNLFLKDFHHEVNSILFQEGKVKCMTSEQRKPSIYINCSDTVLLSFVKILIRVSRMSLLKPGLMGHCSNASTSQYSMTAPWKAKSW